MERTQTRRHPRISPTGSVRKRCNEKRRSQPSKFITTRKLRNRKLKDKRKHDKTWYTPKCKAVPLCIKQCNRLGQKYQGVIRTHKIITEQTHDFHGKRTMAHHQENLLKIMRKLLCSRRASSQIAAPVARSNTEAAPHTSIPVVAFVLSSGRVCRERIKKLARN